MGGVHHVSSLFIEGAVFKRFGCIGFRAAGPRSPMKSFLFEVASDSKHTPYFFMSLRALPVIAMRVIINGVCATLSILRVRETQKVFCNQGGASDEACLEASPNAAVITGGNVEKMRQGRPMVRSPGRS